MGVKSGPEYIYIILSERNGWQMGMTKPYKEDNIVASLSTYLTRSCNSFYSKLYARLAMDEQHRKYEEELLSYVS